MEDGKALYAFDRASGNGLRSINDYCLAAIEGVRTNKERYGEAEARARAIRPVRPSWFNPALEVARARRRRRSRR